MNYVETGVIVTKMIELIRKDNDNPNYAIGYLEAMMRTLCVKFPEVAEEFIETIDYLENKNNEVV